MAEKNQQDSSKLRHFLDVVVSFSFTDDRDSEQLDGNLHSHAPPQLNGQQNAHKADKQECRVLKPRVPLQQLDAIPRNEPKGDDADGDSHIDQRDVCSSEAHGCHHIVKAKAEIEEGNHCNRLAKAMRGRMNIRTFIKAGLLLLGKVITHQPDQIHGAQNHEPLIIHNVAGDEERNDAEPVRPCITNVHGELPLLLFKV